MTWILAEELRPQIPERFFRWLCRFPRGWMLLQPFRMMLFRKVRYERAQTEA